MVSESEVCVCPRLLAGIASIFLPGLGQVLNGEFGKFVAIWALFAISILLIMTVFGAIVGIPMGIAVYIAQVIDAFQR